MDKHDVDQLDTKDRTGNHPQRFARITHSTIEKVKEWLIADGILFRLSDEGIARHFTNSFVAGNAWNVSLAEVRDLITTVDGCPKNAPNEVEKFPKWIRKNIMGFSYSPQQKLAELYELASSDLNEIEKNLAACKQAIKEVERRHPKTDEDPSDIRFYNYYIQLNQVAKDDLINALMHRMQKEALHASYGSPHFGFSFHVPWSFRWNPRGFDFQNFSEIRHALHDLPASDFRKVQDLYECEDKKGFDNFLDAYVSQWKVVDKIRHLVNNHHLLAIRKEVILPALNAYERGERLLFTNAIATQIEGIIEDGCHLSGISITELLKASIINKIEALVRNTPVYIDFAYYAYKFPILRNRIAHGRILAGDVKGLSNLLLLDLYDCCKIVYDHPGANNSLVKLLQQVSSDTATFGDIVTFGLLHVLTKGERPNEFYGLRENFDEMVLLLEQRAVWGFLYGLPNLDIEDLNAGLRVIGNQLKKHCPAIRNSCGSLLQKLGNRGKGDFVQERFLESLRSITDDNPVKSICEVRSKLLGLFRDRDALE